MHIMVNTGGGDAPGLNAVLRSVVLAGRNRGWKVTGIRHGYSGLLDDYPKGLVPLTTSKVRGIAHLGGTILGTANRGHPFEYPDPDHPGQSIDLSDTVIERFRAHEADALIAVGGDGSLKIASRLADQGIPVVGVPKTIDNDISHTQATFGFDTAVHIATEAIDRLHSTAEAHNRVMVVELMGRYAGWIALHAGLAGGADAILIPEIEYNIKKVAEKVMARERDGRRFSIVVAAEGARPRGGEFTVLPSDGRGAIRLGGIAEKVAAQLAELTGKETRSLVLGHLQRGGTPSSRDRLLALRFGAAAVRLVEDRQFGMMVAFDPPRMRPVPIKDAIGELKLVPLDGDTIATVRDLGISLGD